MCGKNHGGWVYTIIWEEGVPQCEDRVHSWKWRGPAEKAAE